MYCSGETIPIEEAKQSLKDLGFQEGTKEFRDELRKRFQPAEGMEGHVVEIDVAESNKK